MALLDFKRKNLASDITAGLTTALVTIPDGMASAVLAGVNPVHGLYALMAGTPVAALTLSSQLMYVANTGALAVAVGSALTGYTGAELVAALIVLTLLVGAIQLLLGVFRLGTLLRFVSNAVLTGFMTGIAVLIVLGQLGEFTGYHSTAAHKIAQAADLVAHLNHVQWQSLVVGLVALVMILLIERTPLAKFNMVLAMLGATLLVEILDWTSVNTVADIADIPRGLPLPVLPDLALVPQLIVPAFAVAIIGLVQASGVSKTVPNPDGEYSNVSRDFAGQGVANLVSGFFRGMPIGGTMSETAVNVNAGARSRWAGIFSGIFITLIVLLFGSFVKRFPMPAISALLIVAGIEALDWEEIADVRDVGWGPRVIMVVTFVATLVLPVTYAVFVGVGLSVVHYVYNSSLDIRLVEVIPQEDGSIEERPAPEALSPFEAIVLRSYGSAFFASMEPLERLLPDVGRAERAVVILSLRGREDIGSTFIRVLERYQDRLRKNGGKLILAGVHENVLKQLEATETTDDIPRDDIYVATSRVGASIQAAMEAADAWLGTKLAMMPADDDGLIVDESGKAQ
jgi:SulP family sulfate permease